MIMRLVVCTLFLTLGACAFADEIDGGTGSFDLRKVTCQELTTMSEEQQGYVVVMIFGYQMGATKQPVQSAASIDRQIKSAYQTCAAEPAMSILEAMAAAGDED